MAGAATPLVTAFKLSKSYKKPMLNLANVTLVSILCSAFYLLGFWQHAGNTASLSASTEVNVAVSAAVSTAVVPRRIFPPCAAEFSEHTPCEDVQRSLKFERERLVYRERHCPPKDEILKCLVPAPEGYRAPFPWPESRELVWFANVPHRELTVEKAVQNWIQVEGDKLRFPGGGTMFPNGADAYLDDIARLIPLDDGSIRTAIDTGCGVASWGAFLLSRNITAMSFAPRDTHEAQVQFALERGVPAIIGILASNRLPYPARAFDVAHCSRCLIPWHHYDGIYLIEIDRILRPGGYWILSGPPINWKRHWKGWERTEDDLREEQSSIESVARSLCWKKIDEKGDLAVWQKPRNHIHCRISRKVIKNPPFCSSPDPDSAWYRKMESCITPLPEVSGIKEIAGGEVRRWPERLSAVPPRIERGGIDGVSADGFLQDSELWRKKVERYRALVPQLGQKYRNLLDMNAKLGGFAAALLDDPLWVMNVVPTVAAAAALGVVYERGLIGTYQDWCEAMSTYPRTYDLLHADFLFTLYQDRCEMENILLEMDRILRPGGTVIIRDDVDVVVRVKSIADGMRWDSQMADHEDGPHHREKLLLAVKRYWTSSPSEHSASTSS